MRLAGSLPAPAAATNRLRIGSVPPMSAVGTSRTAAHIRKRKRLNAVKEAWNAPHTPRDTGTSSRNASGIRSAARAIPASQAA